MIFPTEATIPTTTPINTEPECKRNNNNIYHNIYIYIYHYLLVELNLFIISGVVGHYTNWMNGDDLDIVTDLEKTQVAINPQGRM